MPKIINNIDKDILKLLSEKNSVSITELSEIFNYSVPILRRICKDIAKRYKLLYRRGILQYINSTISREKRLIAEEASSYINDGDTIFLGAGNTILALCQYLHKFQQLTVITNSIPVLTELLSYQNVTTICVGGILQHQDKALVGDFSDNFIQNFQVNKLFLGSEGFDLNKGASRSVIQKNMAEHIITNLNGKIFLLMESFKFDKSCTWLWLPISKIHTLITDSGIIKTYKTELQKTTIQLKIVSTN